MAVEPGGSFLPSRRFAYGLHDGVSVSRNLREIATFRVGRRCRVVVSAVGEFADRPTLPISEIWSAVACHRFGRAEKVGHHSHPFSQPTVIGQAKAVASYRTPKAPVP
jgi:hypothetical protein